MAKRPRNGKSDPASHSGVREALLEDVRRGRLGRGQALPSIRELSRRRGVSKAVAERAVRSLIDDGLCYAEHGRGVFLTVDGPEDLAEALRGTRTVAAVFGFMEYPRTGHAFYRQVYEGTQEWIAGERHNVLKLYSWRSKAAARKDRELARFAGGVDGFVALGIYSDEDCIRLRNTGLPVAVVDYDAESLGIDCAVMDNSATMYDLARRVMDDGPGEVFLFYVERLVDDDPAHAERRAALERAMRESKRDFKPENAIALHADEETHDGERLGAVQAALKAGGARPAVVLDDEYLVERVARGLGSRGFEAGREYLLAYVGPAELPPEVRDYPALVAAYDYRELGRVGGRLLARRMESGPGRPVRATVVGTVREHAPEPAGR